MRKPLQITEDAYNYTARDAETIWFGYFFLVRDFCLYVPASKPKMLSRLNGMLASMTKGQGDLP
jgi:hypothetical protein